MSVVEASSTAVANESSGATATTTVQRGNISSFASTTASTNLTTIDTNGNVFKVPDYSIKEILQAIPKHCYERSLVRSLGYVVRDITMMCLISYVGHTVIPMLEIPDHPTLSYVLRGASWMVQSYLIGLFGFGLWILAHECGHGAFSDFQNINDFIGWVLHSYLMVPYFSWKFSHAKHHKATGHLTKDMVFIPYTKQEYLEKNKVEKVSELVEESPIYSLLVLIFQQLGGLQLYLANNATGQPYPGVAWYARSHYAPSSPVFDKNQYWFIVLSDIGIICTLTTVYQWYKNFGLFNMMINWFVPWLWVNHWLVFVTFLQHTDPTMPHYTASEWTFARGAAATIDRNFGFVGQHIFHDIIETHVLHHYVSRIPFYNAREATEAIKKVMGEHYRYEGESMWYSLWKCVRMCQFVDDDKEDAKGVMMFRNVNGLGVKPKD
ncbi:Delta(12) fatty acid desaturase [Candida viswanathii]|uniref:Delta(12) fatty acid desaturase n=1 Tax=Candida viswanathii TaxID=5486 RepID=A0A367YBR9_9ASCO|nr:Delta(12) fatty acid desaturase [Candida viswanathii]